MRTLLALVVVAPLAHAEGEHGPMFGGAIVGTHGDEVDVVGAGGELAFWYGPLGLGLEGRHQWTVDDPEGPRLTTAGASLRVLAFAHVVPSLLDPRDVVELGLELHAIVEHGWWTAHEDARDATRYGLGAALRLRGATDDDRSNLLAESRVFVRVTNARAQESDIAARGVLDEPRDGVMVILGLGAMWGGGSSAYVSRLRRNDALDSEALLR
ncbi:MAG TPA: hypothetical protein VK427_05160 [Kofleriaceae bacterium]|nr:hypothetical protein [Kofleriaceae bacterium]